MCQNLNTIYMCISIPFAFSQILNTPMKFFFKDGVTIEFMKHVQ